MTAGPQPPQFSNLRTGRSTESCLVAVEASTGSLLDSRLTSQEEVTKHLEGEPAAVHTLIRRLNSSVGMFQT